mgnify:CR=1 FL=1
MTGKHDHVTPARRGTSLAAFALGVSLVVTGVQPVAVPDRAPQAAAADNTWASVSYASATTRIGETVTLSPNLGLLTRRSVSGYTLASEIPAGWKVTLDETSGELSARALPGGGDGALESISVSVKVTFQDGSSKFVTATIALADVPQFDPVKDRVFWKDQAISPVHVRAVKVPEGATLTADSGTYPPGLWLDDRRAVGRYQHVYLNGTPTEAGVFEVRAMVVSNSSGQPLLTSDGKPVETVFKITVIDRSTLPDPETTELAAAPSEAIQPGQAVSIPVASNPGDTVIVTGLPEGLDYNPDEGVITGSPTTPGSYDAVVDVITADNKVLQDTITIEVAETNTPAPTAPESSTPPSPTTSTEPTTPGASEEPTTSGQQPTSGATTQPETTQPTTEPSTTAPVTTTEPVTTEPTTSGAPEEPTTKRPTTSEPPSTSAQPSSPGSSTKPSTSGATSKPTTSGQKPTSGAMTQPATTQPGTTAPTTGASTPATTTAPATTTEPVTTEPTTSGASGKLTTQQPTTKPPTASKPTTQQPSTSAQPIPTAPVPAGDYVWNKLQLQAGSARFAAPNQKPKQPVGVRIEGDAPEWVSVAADGQLVAEPNRDVAPGVYPINVITDNGERGTILVEVAAPVSDADRVTAEYKESFVQAGRTNSSRRPVATIDRDGVKYAKQPLPAGTTFSVSTANGTVDPETGVVTVNAPLSMAAGETIVVGVDIRYPDGTTEKVTAQFVVDAAEQSEFYHPAYKEGLGAQAGRTVVVPVLEDSVPEDGQYELFPQDRDDDWDVSIDPETGAVTATAPEEGAKDISVPVTVLYSDGTTSDREETDPETGERKKVPTVFAHISAVEGPTLATDSTSGADYGTPFFDADGNIRIFPNGSLPQGATFQQDGLTALPVEVDPNTGAITIKVPQDAPAGANFDIPLKITLPDGSVQEIRVPVATKSEAADQVVAWRPIKVTESGTPTQVKPAAAPAGATYALAASFDTPGWQASVDPVSGAITVNRVGTDEDPQAALVPVVVTFADGSQRVVEVPATAVRGTAALTEVDYPRATVNAGQSATLRPSVSDGTFSLVKTVPGLRTVIDPNTGELTVTSFDSTVPGLREIPVQVTFTDSSHLVTSARVEVKTTSGADTYTEGIKLDDVTVIGRPETTSRYTLPVPPHAADRAFSLGEFSVPGWNVTLDEVNGVLEVQVPAGTRGVRQAIPLNVAFADGTVGTFNAVVEVDNVGVAEGSSQSSTGSSTPSPWVWALAVLGLLGTVCKVLYDNREQVLQFLAGWM